jgi:hypothetical protein
VGLSVSEATELISQNVFPRAAAYNEWRDHKFRRKNGNDAKSSELATNLEQLLEVGLEIQVG